MQEASSEYLEVQEASTVESRGQGGKQWICGGSGYLWVQKASIGHLKEVKEVKQ